MGNRRDRTDTIRSKTLPSSPSHSSSSSSDFEFSVPVSPRKSCPADELFYKGQLLPLHLPPRVSMVRSIFLSSSSAGIGARHSTGSSSSSADSFSSDLSHLAAGIDVSCDSARPSFVSDGVSDIVPGRKSAPAGSKYFSLSRFSNAFKKDPDSEPGRPGSRKLEVIRKYLRKVNPFYQILSHQRSTAETTSVRVDKEINAPSKGNNYLSKTRRVSAASCPSSIGSSPTHPWSRKLSKSRLTGRVGGSGTTSFAAHNSDNSTMIELQSAIQGAIAHCKNSMR